MRTVPSSFRFLVPAVLFVLPAATCCALAEIGEAVIPWDQLIENLADPTRVADLGAPGATLLSSHDRTFGNDDFNNVIGTDEDGWEILADLAGPGYISRIWMTGVPEAHRIRIYFDDELEPRIDAAIETLAGAGNTAPFLSPLCLNEQLCFLNQLPIPFQKRVRILSEPREIAANNWPRMFYQIEARALPEGQTVESYPSEIPRKTLDLLHSICARWERESFAPELPKSPKLDHEWVLPPGESGEVMLVPGRGIIRLLRLRLSLPDETTTRARQQVLRQIRLRAFWDGSESASIDVPLGDFFGSPWYSAHFQSMFFGQVDGTFFSRFPMPYAEGARWAVVNESDLPVTVMLGCEIQPHTGSDLGYFHAAWNRTTPQELGQPHPVLRATGRGAYAGCILTVASQVNSWWILESDETIRMDGDGTPSWRGTGLEDYFNGGWYYQFAQVRPTHGVLYKAPFRTIQFRTHPADPVHFASEIDLQFERGPGNGSPGWMESTAFYYLAQPQAAAFSVPPPAQRSAPDSTVLEYTLMTRLINFERLGDLAAAIQAIDDHLERFPDASSDMLRLRQLAYRERLEGLDEVRQDYEQTAARPGSTAVSAQARDLLWFHEDPSHALLSVYCRNQTVVYLDGKPMVRAMDPRRIFTLRVTLTPGPHALALEAVHEEYPDWLLAHLRTHHGSVATMPDWRFAYEPTGSWKNPGFDDSDWYPMKGNGIGGPPDIPFVYIQPNSHVLNLSEARGLRPRGPGRRDGGTFVYRKEFEIPSSP